MNHAHGCTDAPSELKAHTNPLMHGGGIIILSAIVLSINIYMLSTAADTINNVWNQSRSIIYISLIAQIYLGTPKVIYNYVTLISYI